MSMEKRITTTSMSDDNRIIHQLEKRTARGGAPWAHVAAYSLACAALCGTANAQTTAPAYPVKPVRMINPFSPGGSLDLVARLLAKSLTGDLGQQFIVENRPGAGGSIEIGRAHV